MSILKWSGALVVGTDPGGAEALRVTGSVRVSSSIILGATLVGNSSANGDLNLQPGTSAGVTVFRSHTGSLVGFVNTSGDLNMNSTVTASGGFFVTGAGSPQPVLAANGAATGAKYVNFSSTGGNLYFGLESSTGGVLLSGSSAYATVLGSGNATNLEFFTNNAKRITIASGGSVTINSGSLIISGNQFRVTTSFTPASAAASGVQGDIAWDSSFIYICVATNTWKRVAIATW